MNLKSIEYFIAVAETGSFTKAAEKLFISQPALSQQIKRLESELGGKLFDRGKNITELTEIGKVFLRESGRILQIYNQLLLRVYELEHPSEEIVHFGISPFYSQHYLPLLLPALIRSHPSIRYEVNENYSCVIEKALIDGHLDFCLVPLLPENPLLIYDPVYTEKILLAVPKDSQINQYSFSMKGFNYINLKSLREEPFIALKSAQKVSTYSRQLCEQAGFVPNVICETMNWHTLNQLVSAGLGVGFVPDLLANRNKSEENSVNYYHIFPNAERIYTIAYRQGDTLSASATVMVEVFKGEFARLSKQER